MTVKVRNYINGVLKSEEVVSSRSVEYYFVISALYYISKDKSSNSLIESYKAYLKSIALSAEESDFVGVVRRLGIWLKNNTNNYRLNHIFVDSQNRSEFCVI